MEARKITIVSTKTQKKSVIMSSAETLAQLKEDLIVAGIDYDDMTFYEGLTKTELKSDDSVLPKDVPYTNRTTGESIVTNELVFMLTNTNKKIKSGSYEERKTLYNEIKNRGLKQACFDKYGKNYTTCSNDELISVIAEHNSIKVTVPTYAEAKQDDHNCCKEGLIKAFYELVNILFNEATIDSMERDHIINTLEGKNSLFSPYTKDEIAEMFSDIVE